MSEVLPRFWDWRFPTFRKCREAYVAAKTKRREQRWQTIVSIAGLPPLATETIGKVVRRSRLWRGERSDVAQELIAHFQDGLESETSPEELVQKFGDARIATKLIRRAKIRCRPMWWQAWWWVSRTLAALIGIYLLMAVWQAFARPSVKTDYLALHNAPIIATPEQDRAWPLYREALVEMNWMELPKWFYEINPKKIQPSEQDWPAFAEWLRANRHAVDLIRTGSRRRVIGLAHHENMTDYSPADRAALEYLTPGALSEIAPFPPNAHDRSGLFDTNLADIHQMPLLTRILLLDYLYQVKQQQGAAALDALQAMLGLSRQCDHGSFIQASSIAFEIQTEALQAFERTLADQPTLWTDRQLTDFAHTLAANEFHPNRWLQGERYKFEDILQRIYNDDGQGDGRITPAGLEFLQKLAGPGLNGIVFGKTPGERLMHKPNLRPFMNAAILPRVNMLVASRKEMLAMYDRLLKDAERQFALPFRVHAEENGWLGEHPENNQFPYERYLVAYRFFPGNLSTRSHMELTAARKDAALLGIALELYRREHGDWPKALADLTPRWLPTLPIDRINNRPLEYKILDGHPTVYGWGYDGDDDGGRLPNLCDGRSDYYMRLIRNHPAGYLWNEGDDGDWIIWTTAPPSPQEEPKPVEE